MKKIRQIKFTKVKQFPTQFQNRRPGLVCPPSQPCPLAKMGRSTRKRRIFGDSCRTRRLGSILTNFTVNAALEWGRGRALPVSLSKQPNLACKVNCQRWEVRRRVRLWKNFDSKIERTTKFWFKLQFHLWHALPASVSKQPNKEIDLFGVQFFWAGGFHPLTLWEASSLMHPYR